MYQISCDQTKNPMAGHKTCRQENGEDHRGETLITNTRLSRDDMFRPGLISDQTISNLGSGGPLWLDSSKISNRDSRATTTSDMAERGISGGIDSNP